MISLNTLILFVLALTLPVNTHSADRQLRPCRNDQELQSWLQNMAWHRYNHQEMAMVTGLDEQQVALKLKEFRISVPTKAAKPADRLLMLPYPGGRHPRIGFLDGAVDPWRETKISVFCPWDDHSYVVADIPEAIWSNLGLTWLAHTHVPTIWDKQGLVLPVSEWSRTNDQTLQNTWRLPNGIEFGTTARADRDHVRMTMWLKNGTDKPLSDLRVQNCVMLKGAAGFADQTNENKRFEGRYSIAATADKTRWIITGWSPIDRAWGNAPCPCLHADPKFPDCAPGETKTLHGWLSFYEGSDIDSELQRINATGWFSP